MFVCVLSCYSSSLMLHCPDVGMLEALENNGDISEMDLETLQKSRSDIVTWLRWFHFVFLENRLFVPLCARWAFKFLLEL